MFQVENWFVFALIALVLWGFWGFFPKLATNYINPKSVLIYEVAGVLIVGLIVLYTMGFKPETNAKGVLFGVLTGIAGLVGTLFFLFAISRGKASVVVTMTALYPLITIFLSFFVLNESITVKQGVGMVFALLAVVLLAE